MVEVSAVIPTYNRPEHLPGAIDSVLAQTFENLEVVVVDDGSDSTYTRETVAEYPSNVRCVVHDDNRGLSAARNTGIDAARGKYIAFLDDDDRWTTTKIARQVAALENNPGAGLATCLLTTITPDGKLLRCEGNKPSGDLSDQILVRNVIGTPSRVLVRADCFDTLDPFDETLPTKQDWDFYIRLCQNWEVECIEDHLCRRVVHESMSSSPQAARDDNRRVIDKHEDRIRERGLLDETMAAYYANVGRTYVEDGDMYNARRYFSRSLDRKFRLWHLGMHLMTYLGSEGAGRLIDLKRQVERYVNCRDVRDTT